MIKSLLAYLKGFAKMDWIGIWTAVSAISTLTIALLTLFLWNENRMLRKAGSSPRVIAHFDMHPEGTGGINMSLSNIGTGPALDVSFEIAVDKENFSQYGIELDTSRKRAPMTLIAQGGKVSFLFGLGSSLFWTKEKKEFIPLKPFKVVVKWKTVGSREVFTEECVLDISQYAGLPGMMTKPPILKVADELRGIKKQLGKITSWEPTIVDLIDGTKPDQKYPFRAILVSPRDNQNTDINPE